MKISLALAMAGVLGLPAASHGAQNYGDTLIQREMARHPELLSLSLYATIPKASSFSVLAASDRGVAEAAIASAQAVQRSGQPLQVPSADGSALVSYLPMLDVAGETIGTVGVALPQRGVVGTADQLSLAGVIRDELHHKVISAANLTDPYPYVPDAQTSPYAQQLVDSMMERHPELLVLALHVKNASGSDYPIIASNIGRIGKPADGDDMQVVRSGQPLLGAYGPNQSRFGIELPMYDRDGVRIGAISVGFRHKAGDDEQTLLRQALRIEAELSGQIHSLALLIAPRS